MKIKHILAALALLPVLTSCDFLDEYDPNATTTGNFYSSEKDIATSLNGVYASLAQQGYYFENIHFFTDTRANVTVIRDSGANSGIPYQFYNYTITEENSYVYNRYTQLFKTIARANTVLAHLDDVSYANSSTRDTYEAEARFLRGLTYFYLVTEWGDVPLILRELTTTDEVASHNHRVAKEEVYKAIFADMKYVTESPLADIQSAAACGRASKVAAWALWGKATLQMACDDDFETQKSDLLTQAVEKLTAAWNLRPFSQLSDIPYANIWNLSTQKSCPEALFQVNFLQGNATLSSVWNYKYGPIQSGTTSLRTGGLENAAKEEYYNSFEAGDIRKAYLRATTASGVTYYHTMKFVDLECGTDGYGGNNYVVLRHADVVLMLAEACYWQGDEATAKTWLNMVRSRAGLGAWSGTDLRQGIYDERLHEFMQEGLRWQDLLRMYSRTEMIQHFNAINSNFALKDLLLPIPYNERILNPAGLYQNPGYGQN